MRFYSRIVGGFRGSAAASACARCVARLGWLVAVVWLALAPTVYAGPLAEIPLWIGEHIVTAEVADTPATRNRGLMQRDRLAENHGMLFVFDEAAPYSIWMKDTPLPLAVAFIDAHGEILNIAEMTPLSLDTHTANGDVLYALEMNAGWFSKHGIGPGSCISGLAHALPTR